MRFSYLNRRHVYLYSGSQPYSVFGYNQSLSEISPAVTIYTHLGNGSGETSKGICEIGYGMRISLRLGISYSMVISRYNLTEKVMQQKKYYNII